MLTNELRKVAKIFRCDVCDYTTSRKSSYDKHLSTRKHKWKQMHTNVSTFFQCSNCDKNYKTRAGLWKHNKLCTFIEEENIDDEVAKNGNTNVANCEVESELVGQLIDKIINPLVKNQNDMVTSHNDLQNLVVTQQQQINEIIPKIGNTNTNCNNTMNNTTNNNKFNMNIYLNEKCKDAISLVDFIDNLKITDADFDTTRTEGIVSGLTDIFTNELRDLDVRKLPIHCSDIRRETFYIKEEDEWVKDDCKKSILSRAIDKAKGKANKFLPVWIDDHPNCWKSDSPFHTEWMNVVTIRFGDGDPKFNEKNTKKILKNIAAEVLIDKETAMIDEA